MLTRIKVIKHEKAPSTRLPRQARTTSLLAMTTQACLSLRSNRKETFGAKTSEDSPPNVSTVQTCLFPLTPALSHGGEREISEGVLLQPGFKRTG
jgi:hypothetical protein